MWDLFSSEKLFTLVSNMQISRFNVIIHIPRNWSDSSTLIYPDAILSYRPLTCSSVVSCSSFRSQTCCSLGDLDESKLGTYDGTDIGLQEGSTERTTSGKLKDLLLGDWLGSLDGIELGTNVDNELGLSDWKVLGTTLENVDRITLGIDIGTELCYLNGFFDGSNDGKLEGLLIGYLLGYNDGKVLGSDEGIKL